jgi:hypothetical protein
MPEKKARARPARTGGAAAERARRRERAFAERLDDILMDATEPWNGRDDGRAGYVQGMVRALAGLVEMKTQMAARRQQEVADATNDDAERGILMARLAGLIARLEQEGADRCPACGRHQADPERLARLGRTGAATG